MRMLRSAVPQFEFIYSRKDDHLIHADAIDSFCNWVIDAAVVHPLPSSKAVLELHLVAVEH